MPFITYSTITNYYNTKDIDYFQTENPEFAKCQFVVQHKYDGSNFQVIFEKNTENNNEVRPFRFASRNCILEEHENFNNFKSLIVKDPYKKMLENVKKHFAATPDLTCLNLYGEIYGKVIKRINYYAPGEDQTENKLVFFDAKFNERSKSTKFFTEWAKEMEIPVVETYLIGSYDECLEVDVSQFKTAAGDQIEGVVIKAYDHENEAIRAFYLKKKMPGFDEIQVKKTPNKVKTTNVEAKPKLSHVKCTDEQKADMEEFEAYLNANRLTSAFSKKAWAKTETKALAREMLADALKDFRIDHEATKVDLELAEKAYMPDIFKLIKTENIFN
jgi:hypothetical protein